MGICIALQCVKETRTPGSDLCGMHYFRLRRCHKHFDLAYLGLT